MLSSVKRLQPDRGEMPLAVALGGALLLILAFICVLIGVWGLVFPHASAPADPDSDPVQIGVRWFPLAFGFCDLFAAISLLRGSPRSLFWAAGCAWVSMASVIAAVDGINRFDLPWAGPGPTNLQRALRMLSLDEWGTLLYVPAFLLGVWLIKGLLLDKEVRQWSGSPLADSQGYAPPEPGRLSFWLRICVPATLLFLLWNQISAILSPISDVIIEHFGLENYTFVDRCLAGYGLVSLAYLSAIGVVLWRLTERVAIDDSGVRSHLFGSGLTVQRADWSRVRLIQIVRHDHKEPTAIMYYRSRRILPCSMKLEASKFTAGRDLVERTLAKGMRSGVAIRESYSPDWMIFAGWAVILLGIGFIVGQQLYTTRLYSRFSVEGFPIDQFDHVAGLFPLTALYLSSVAAISVGLGMLSAFHRGRGSTLMLCAWLCGMASIPTPILHWLVWVAIYAILCAIQTPLRSSVTPPPTMSPMPDWDVAMGAMMIAPLLAAVCYGLGVVVGRRRKAVPSGVTVPSPVLLPN